MSKYAEYEYLKGKLDSKNLPPKEYERELKKIIKRLKI